MAKIVVWFDPGPARLQMVKAIKDVLNKGLREAKDAVDLGRCECDESDKQRLINAIEDCGGKIQ